jgi:hypothetical protein
MLGFAMMLAATATSLADQPPGGAPEPSPAFIQAAQEFGQCLQRGAAKLAATVTPEAGATQVVAGCTQQRTDLSTHFEAWVSSSGFPEAGRPIAREEFQAELNRVETHVAAGIRRARAAPAPTKQPSN